MPPADENGGGPAGGGVPGGASRKFLTSSKVLPGASFSMISSCTCVPTFLICTVPVPVNDASGRNVNSLSEMLPPSTAGAVVDRVRGLRGRDLADHAVLGVGLAVLVVGDEARDSVRAGVEVHRRSDRLARIDVVRATDELHARERLDVGGRRGRLERSERNRTQLRERDLVTDLARVLERDVDPTGRDRARERVRRTPWHRS